MEFFLLEVTGGPHEFFADRQIFNALAEYFSVAMSKLFLRGDAVISGTRQALTTRIHPRMTARRTSKLARRCGATSE